MLRATFKSLLSRKLRLILAALAVVLGVTFVSGALVLTDTVGRSFDNLFTGIYEYTDIEVARPPGPPGFDGQPVRETVPAADVARVAAVSGVRSAIGQVFVDGARVVGKNGKVVLGTGGPRYGANWLGENELVVLREGRGPQTSTEIVLSANVAKTTGYAVGDQVGVLTIHQPLTSFTIVGISGYSGGRDSLAGETIVFFTEPTAQTYMLGEQAVFNSIDVKVADDTKLNATRAQIATVLGSGYEVRTGAELAADSAAGVKQALTFFSYLLLGFAGVALFVGTFLILNTFSIIVAQRTRELALFRAIGASRGQVIGSVLTEAVVIGLIASVLGLGLGIGVGALLGNLMGSLLSGGTLELAGLAVPWSAVIASFAVGLGITVVAALLPALRAARIAPVAAMRDSATPDRPLTTLTTVGSAVLVGGGVLLGLGLTGKLGSFNLWAVLVGLMVCFVAVALLTPIVSRPVVAVLGRAIGWRAAGELGQRNSARNPRRTAITAAALMVSIALVTGISVIFSSIKASTVEAVDNGVNADLVIASDPLSGGLGAIDPAAIQQIRQLPGVAAAVGVYGDVALIDGREEFVGGFDDAAAAKQIIGLEPAAGSLVPLAAGTVIVDDKLANDRGLRVGSTLDVRLARNNGSYTVVGIYKRSGINSGFYFGLDAATTGFSRPAPLQGFVALAPGTSVDAVFAQVETLLKDSPEVSLSKLDDFVAAQTQIFDFVLIFVQLLLALAMIIAVLGIINTLALSMTERTRELGLLRAVGLKRGQLIWMITVESIVISVFGAVLGVAVGCGLGAAVFQALRDQGFTELAFPWPLMLAYIAGSVVVGLIAAFVPAIRATRLDVLKAIAYE